MVLHWSPVPSSTRVGLAQAPPFIAINKFPAALVFSHVEFQSLRLILGGQEGPKRPPAPSRQCGQHLPI